MSMIGAKYGCKWIIYAQLFCRLKQIHKEKKTRSKASKTIAKIIKHFRYGNTGDA